LQVFGAAAEEPYLPVAVDAGRGVVDGDLDPVDVQRRQVVAFVGVAEVGWLLEEDRPRVQPHEELFPLVRVQGEVVGLRGVALEEPGERLAGVHDAEESCVVDEFLVPVR
jgi:hypothetical protein